MMLRWVLAFAVIVGLGWGAMGTSAQSSAQIQQIMSMSPAERQRLMRQFGVSEQDVMRMLGEQRSATGASGAAPSRLSRPTDMDPQGFEFDPQGDFFGGMQPGLMQPAMPTPRDDFDDGDLSGRVDYSRRHGLEVFSRSFMPYQELFSIPVPDDYVIGPGDVFQVSLFGTESNQFYLPVQRDGWIDFPALGPIAVSGMTFADAKRVVADRVAREKLGVRTSITLEQLKSIQLAVSGEVKRPGVYVVPSLVSVIQLLNLAGGATDVGALRRVRLLRAGERLDIDLYDFIIAGERSDVIGLKPGDRLHLPAVEAAVHVKGAVRRAGVYEILPGETLEDVLRMAGGPAPDAALGEAVLRRYASDGEQQIVDIDLRARDGRRQALSDGMILRVPRATEFTATRIEVKGEVTVPGVRQWREGMRLSHVFRDLRRDLNVGRADLDQGYIVRTDGETRQLSFLSFSLREMFRQPGSEHDHLLQQEDVVLVLPIPGVVEQDRERRRQDEERDAEPDERETVAQQTRRGGRRGPPARGGGGGGGPGEKGGGGGGGGGGAGGGRGGGG
ncbi:MAG: polysaccharide export protein, partial [Gammaproteobacteria bacterium]|nr:polysaccharide export protein [Gammaproteobacteria bacterium]